MVFLDDPAAAPELQNARCAMMQKEDGSLIGGDVPPPRMQRTSSRGRPQRRSSWLRFSANFVNKDPRHQLLSYFRSLAAYGDAAVASKEENDHSFASFLNMASFGDENSPVHHRVASCVFNRAAVFAMFRPTSREAIRKMMQGEAVGKGLDIKGKSAKTGRLSALIPFLQIYEEADKKKARWPPSHGRIRIFYINKQSRENVREYLETIADEMVGGVVRAKLLLDRANPTLQDESIQLAAMEKLIWEVEDPVIYRLDENSPQSWGLDVPERVFFEGCINRQDISRPPGSAYETGRESAPPFQDLNFHATRDYDGVGAQPVVLQTAHEPELALQPQSLVMAYEENNQVLPVASDFDCFVIGTRRIAYKNPLPSDQVELLHWLLDNIEDILDHPSSDGWTQRWFSVLKKSSLSGFHPTIPRFGFGDPTSYSIIEGAVTRLHHSGGIRHGAECFNYYFPQELDDEFLVISELFPEKPWKYIPLKEVQGILYQQVLEGFAFPLNPKWILCDPGWYKIFDAMLQSTNPTIIEPMNVWFPEEIRRKIVRIHEKHPQGFVPLPQEAHVGATTSQPVEGTEAMDLAGLELRRFLVKKRAKLKLRTALLFLSQQKAAEKRKKPTVEKCRFVV